MAHIPLLPLSEHCDSILLTALIVLKKEFIEVITKPNLADGIHTLTSFKRDSGPLIEQMKTRREPIVLTVNGKAEAVMIDPATYESWLEELETVQAVRASMASFERGEGKPARQAFKAMRSRLPKLS